jgi:hypothetical protein
MLPSGLTPAQKTSVEVYHIDRFFPSTKLCRVCGNLKAFITLRDCARASAVRACRESSRVRGVPPDLPVALPEVFFPGRP